MEPRVSVWGGIGGCFFGTPFCCYIYIMIYIMNNDGATPMFEKTNTVPVGIVEELFKNNVNILSLLCDVL